MRAQVQAPSLCYAQQRKEEAIFKLSKGDKPLDKYYEGFNAQAKVIESIDGEIGNDPHLLEAALEEIEVKVVALETSRIASASGCFRISKSRQHQTF